MKNLKDRLANLENSAAAASARPKEQDLRPQMTKAEWLATFNPRAYAEAYSRIAPPPPPEFLAWLERSQIALKGYFA